jgi:accessory secretory protein Asp3
MPAGTVIRTWYSMVNFQEKGSSRRCRSSTARVAITCPSTSTATLPQGIFLRFVFFGKNGEEAGSLVMDQPEMDLKCPLKTYSYEAQLICAGAHAFRFHSFTITEREQRMTEGKDQCGRRRR